MPENTTFITTQIHTESDDFDIRQEFCGFQDSRLNDLRQFTSCIIDIQTHGKRNPFENVTWIITHYNDSVRDFVVRRIQAWGQMTQIAAYMHDEDLSFYQQTSLDSSSSSSIDAKAQQIGNSIKSLTSPSVDSVPTTFHQMSKTPSNHNHQYGSAPNAALVPQTDIHSRYQQRRRRNSSSSSSGICRPALFGKPSDYFLSRTKEHPKNQQLPLLTDATKCSINKHNTKIISKQIENKESSFEYSMDDLEEEAKWSNLLSDASDFESNSHPLMADIILVSQLRDCLVNSHVLPTDSIEDIKSNLTKPLSIISTEQLKMLNNKPIWFHRLTLNSKIILSNGIHKSKEQSEKLAYRKMIELMTNKQGVEPKIISNGRCKVVIRKSSPTKNLNETTLIDSIMNNTIDAY